MKIKSLIKHNLMRAAMTLALILACATAWAQTTQSVTYIDADGQQKTVSATLIEDGYDEMTLSAGQWYVVSSDDVYGYAPISVNGDGAANIILADGAWFTYGGANATIVGSLNIYGQSEGTGKFDFDNSFWTGTEPSNLIIGNLTIYGGHVILIGHDGEDGSNTQTAVSGNVTIYRGSLYAKGGSHSWWGSDAITGNVSFYGGNLEARGGSGSEMNGYGIYKNIYLSWSSNSDRFFCDRHSDSNSITIEANKFFVDEENTIHSRTNVGNIADHILQPLTGWHQNGNVYTISDANGWNAFCEALQDNETYNHFSGKTVELDADITVTRMAGGSDHAFVGTFDGQGHTLTVNYGSASAPLDAQFVAPFVEVRGNAEFFNLTIDGSIYVAYTTTEQNPQPGVGGLIGHLFGGITIEGCTSTVEINSTKDRVGGFVGLCEHAVTFTNCKSSAVVTCTGSGSGFVGWSRASDDPYTIAFVGCLFNGKILKKNNVGSGNGGFVGWTGSTKTVSVTNSLVDPATPAEGETMADDNSATFARGWSGTPTNSYYTTAFGREQGTQAYSISKGEYVTTLEISGEPTNSYPVSGLDYYSVGLKCGDVLYAAVNNVVSLTLAHQDREGYDFIGYTATAGNLNGSSLTMPDGNVTINAEYTCTAPSELTATDITFTTATLNWNGLQESYNVRYRTDGANEWQTIDNIAVTTTTLSGLLSGTTYEWQVQGLDCDGEGGTTEWSAATFTTLSTCEVQPSELTATDITATTATLNWNGSQESYNVRYQPVVILNEGFESGTMPEGWTRTGTYWQITSGTGYEDYTGAATGNYNAGCYINSNNRFDILITPVMDLGNVASATLSFNFWNNKDGYGEYNILKVHYRVDEGEWHLLYTYENATEGWIPVTINLEGMAAHYQIGFEYESHYSYGMGIDDVKVIGINTSEWTTVTNVSSPHDITGLTPETQYVWQVQGSNCDGEGSTTEWSEVGTFTTLSPCEVAPSGLTATSTATTATLNWNGFQESYSVRYLPFILYEGFESGTMPDGWTRTGAYGWSWEVTSGTGFYDHTGAATGNYNAGCYFSTYGGSGILITPVMDLGNVASAALSFNFWNTDWDGDISILKVHYRVNGGEWHSLYTYSNATGGWIPVTIILEGLAANYQIGFECVSHGSYGMGIDDVKVTGINTSEWTTVTNVSSPHNLTGLTPETQYLWQVQGLDCDGEGSTTEWSEMGIFTTPLHDPVAYIDANGQTQQCTDYTPLTGTETTLTAGWYVADDTLDYDHTITLSGDIHLILKDNAVMNVTSTEGYGFYYNSSSIPPSISIYAQSTGESKGQLHVDASVHGLYTSNDITINGGWVEATSNQSYGIFASSGNVIINGGIVEATGGVYGIFGGNSVEIHGGEVTAIGPSYGINAQPGSVVISGGKVTATATNGTGIHARYSITISGGQVTANGRYDGIYTYDGIILGWTNASDFIYASSFYINNSNNYITLSKAFIDEDGQTYSGTIAKESGGAYPIDGKWLYPNTVSRFTKTIAAHHTEGGVNYGWYLIASPLSSGTNAEAVAHLVNSETPANFDLYRFNQAAELEWENWKQQNSDHYHFNLEPGRGYLYANAADVNLVFAGTPYSGNGEVTLQKTEGAELSGWNLVGNPFSVDAYIGRDFYVLNEARSEVMPEASTGAIPSMEGVFVLAEQDKETVTFSTEAHNKGRASKPEQVVLNLSRDRGLVIDRAIVRMGEGCTLPKFQLNRNSTKLYIPQDGTDYAIACAESTGEMPVNFKAKENGEYTITVNPENVEMAYLHLVDNMTGTDIDLLSPSLTPLNAEHLRAERSNPDQPATYTFTAKTTDYESRFKLVFASNNEDGPSTGSGTFAFYSNGNWIIANEGEATLQVIDITGRILSSETVNGSVSKAIQAAPGVYVLRLINGDNVRTQKVVVK